VVHSVYNVLVPPIDGLQCNSIIDLRMSDLICTALLRGGLEIWEHIDICCVTCTAQDLLDAICVLSMYLHIDTVCKLQPKA
jgi:hypothetical protein